MTDKYRSLTVVLDGAIDDDDVTTIAQAIRSIRGVDTVDVSTAVDERLRQKLASIPMRHGNAGPMDSQFRSYIQSVVRKTVNEMIENPVEVMCAVELRLRTHINYRIKTMAADLMERLAPAPEAAATAPEPAA